MTNRMTPLAAFAAWTLCAGALGYGVRVGVERWQSYRRFKRIWPSIERRISDIEQAKRTRAAMNARRGDLHA